MFSGKSVEGESGELVCLKPFPSMPVNFWNDPDGSKYKKAYFDKFEGEIYYYRTEKFSVNVLE